MTKIFLVYGHYNEKSFNAAIRDTFIKTANENGNEVAFGTGRFLNSKIPLNQMEDFNHWN